jgi:hypothetical protein
MKPYKLHYDIDMTFGSVSPGENLSRHLRQQPNPTKTNTP